jgi:hypothetical protein
MTPRHVEGAAGEGEFLEHAAGEGVEFAAGLVVSVILSIYLCKN